MKLADLVNNALGEFKGRLLRTFLTLLGIVFGVAAVVAMLNIGKGARTQASEMVRNLGVENVIIRATDVEQNLLMEQRSSSLGLSFDDMHALADTLPFVEHASAIVDVNAEHISLLDKPGDIEVIGVTAGYDTQSNLTLSEGRFFHSQDQVLAAQVVVLGASAKKRLFGEGNALGQYIKINHLWLKVVGLLAPFEHGNKDFEGVKVNQDDYRILMPVATAKKRFVAKPLASEVSAIKLTINAEADKQAAVDVIRYLLNKRHNGIDDYSVLLPAELLAQHNQTQSIFNVVMISVASISLLVGGIGIMNIMLANVLERKKEIGLLRAVGATRASIFNMFLTESITLSVVGGLLGLFLGFALSFVISTLADWPIAVSYLGMLGASALCLLTGVVFGTFPARRAAAIDPIAALQNDG